MPLAAIALALLSGALVRVSSPLVESLEEEGRGSWEEFQRERERYGAGARDIAEERKSAWERDEEFRKSIR
jgi:hypothetical protein